MFWKILLTLGALLVLWGVFFRKPVRPPRLRKKSRGSPLADQTLVKCNSCGIYLAAGDRCACTQKD